MKKIGITGTIASGKTSAAILLKRHGFAVFNADQYARMCTNGGNVICEQLKKALENAGLAEIKAMDETFDPNVHNAVMTESIEEKEDGTVTKVFQKGYTLKDKVIRPSMVAVNKK